MKPKTLYFLCLTTLSIVTMPLTQAAESQTILASTEKKTGVCFCLRHTTLRTIVKNCEWNKRPRDVEPHLFCMDAQGENNTPRNLKNWEELPANNADCRPCDEVAAPTSDSGSIRGD